MFKRDIHPIPGIALETLPAIAGRLHLDCSGPRPQGLQAPDFNGWRCSGPLSSDDLASLLTFDYITNPSGGVVSVSVQLHATPRTSNFAAKCREVMGYVLATMEEKHSVTAMAQLDVALRNGETVSFEVDSVMFRIIMNTERSLTFDFHSKGF